MSVPLAEREEHPEGCGLFEESEEEWGEFLQPETKDESARVPISRADLCENVRATCISQFTEKEEIIRSLEDAIRWVVNAATDGIVEALPRRVHS